MEELVVAFQKWFKCCLSKGWKRAKTSQRLSPNLESSTIKQLGFLLWEGDLGERYDDIQAITRVLSLPEVIIYVCIYIICNIHVCTVLYRDYAHPN